MALITRSLSYDDFLEMEAWLDKLGDKVQRPSIEVTDWDKAPEEQTFCACVEISDPSLATYFKLTWC